MTKVLKFDGTSRVIGSKSKNPLVAAMWYLFCRPNK